MSTLSSWIDPAEISELLPFLLPDEGGRDEAATPEVVAAAEIGDEIPTDQSADPESGTGPVETVEVFDARAGRDAAPGEEGAAESLPENSPEPPTVEPEAAIPAAGSEIDFNTSDAYDAAAFPEPVVQLPDGGPSSPERQAAAVQAAVTLERARSRADEVGLLKGNKEDSRTDGPAATEAEAEAEAEKDFERPAVVGLEEPPGPQAADETETVPELPESPAESELVPGTFRDRLANFAGTAVEMTGGTDPAITDFQSYPLYPATNGRRAVSPQAVESILRMNRLIGEFQGRKNGDDESTAQIALNDGRWLCILTQDSASGGVCASLKTPAPVSKETATQLHHRLRAALIGPSI